MNLTLGSLFDGSGTAPLAASLCGITPVWASEIEPYPIRVTTKRFPHMQHLGSITDIDGAKVKPVDIICGGSPCQDLSVAGKQKGLDGGTRSHLFYEMTRIIKEMRKASNGKYPRFIVWENVPGAFSSNNGRDFLSVLQSFAEIAETDVYVPEPERKADKLVWRNAGEVVGCGWSIAWRTVDAQYWGVPQRRRRIYLVVDLDSECAGEILFECKSLSGNIEPGRETRKGTAADSESGAGGSCEETELIKAFDITGASSNSMKSLNAHSCFKEREISRTIDSFVTSPECNQGGTAIVEYKKNVPVVYPGVGITSKKNGSNPKPGDMSPTLDTDSRKYLVYANTGFAKYQEGITTLKANGGDCGGGSENICINVFPDITGALMANSHPGSYSGQDAYNDMFPVFKENTNYIVRRLTPLECSRLQGFPDCWELDLETKDPSEEDIAFWSEVFETHRKVVSSGAKPKTRNQIIKWLQNPYSDSASYKMWGNGMALPNMLHVMKGIVNLCSSPNE